MQFNFNNIIRAIALFLIIGSCVLGLKADSELLNSYAEARRYNEVCWLTTHNAFANLAEGWQYENQNLSFKEQYQLGVRSFMLDVYWYRETFGKQSYIALCHEHPTTKSLTFISDCFATVLTREFAKPQSLESYFVQIKKWLDENPEEIITLHLESYLGAEGAAGLRKLLKDTGLEPYLYADKFPRYFQTWDNIPDKPGPHKIAARWPTLKEMRQRNGRLVIFSDKVEDGMISTYSYDESEYDLGTSPDCGMRRSLEPAGTGILLMMNHFYKYEPKIGYEKVNAYEAILKRTRECHQKQKRWPNFIAVDFVEIGENGGAKAVVTQLNKNITAELSSSQKREEL